MSTKHQQEIGGHGSDFVSLHDDGDTHLPELRRANLRGEEWCLGEVVRGGGVLTIELSVHILRIQC